MSWVRLLVAGSSVISLRNGPGRYKVQRHGLPEFGGKPARTLDRQDERKKELSARAKGPKTMATKWWRNILGRGKKGVTSQPVVQAELALDLVKPVRNDLSECDLEIRRVRVTAPAAKEAGRDGWKKMLGRSRQSKTT